MVLDYEQILEGSNGGNFYLHILEICSAAQRAQRAHTNPRRDRELKRTKATPKSDVCVCVCVC